MGAGYWPRRFCAAAVRGARHAIGLAFESLTDFFIPDGCLVCGATGDVPSDWARVPEVEALLGAVRPVPGIRNRPLCASCAGALVVAERVGTLRVDFTTTACGEVGGPSSEGATRAPGPTLAVVSPFMTSDAILTLVHHLKFRGGKELAAPMADAMARAFHRTGAARQAGFLCPVPMRSADRRRRGFNQAEILAEGLGRRLRLPVKPAVLEKVRRTARQSVTTQESRADNVRGAFRATAGLRGQHVWLVDDLVTTGATASACAEAFLAAGAGRVGVLCFARAL